MAFAGLFITVPLLAFSTVYAEEQSTSDQSKKLDSIRTIRKEKISAFRQSNPYVQVRIDSISGTPKWLEGKLSEGLTKSDPVEIALEFFERNKGIFGISQPLSELRLERVRTGETGMKHVFFKQFYGGVEVWNGKINAHFTSKGKLDLVNGSLYPDIDISTTPRVDVTFAEVKAKNDLPRKSKNVQMISSELRVFPHQNNYYLVWLVKIHVDSPPGAWEYFIDANSGQILHKANRIMRINLKDNLTKGAFVIRVGQLIFFAT